MKSLYGILSLSILIFLFSGCKKSAENGSSDSEIKKVIPGNFSYYHGYNTLCPTSDNGFAVTALIDSHKIYVARLNSAFDVLWSRTCGSCVYDVGGIVESSDKGFVVVGNLHDTTSYPYKLYVELIKYNQAGDLIWDKKYLFRYMYESGFGIRETPDKGFIIATVHDKWDNQGLHFIELFKVNADGDSLWSRDFADHYMTSGHDIQMTSDNGFIVVGESIIMRTDSIGNKLWDDYLPMYSLTNVRVLPDGSFVALGTKEMGTANNWDYILRKYDSNGNLIWEKNYDVDKHEWSCNLCLTPEGGFMFTGFTSIGNMYEDVIIKTDGAGNKLGMKIINPYMFDNPRGIVWQNGSYVFFGATVSGGSTYSLMLLRFNL